MLPKYHNNNTLSTPLPTQTVATCLISSTKIKSIWQIKVEQPLLESLSEMGKLPCLTNIEHQNYRDRNKFSCSRLLSDGEFQMTEPW